MNGKRMAVVVVVGIVAFLIAGWPPAARGQDKPAPAVVIPDVKDVAEIRFTANAAFLERPRDPRTQIDLKLRTAGQIKPVLDWLRGIGWDKSKAEDITQLKMVALLIIVAEIHITKKDRTTQHFQVQPGRIIEGNSRWNADIKKLRAVIQRLR
jgi:hypothetical protein